MSARSNELLPSDDVEPDAEIFETDNPVTPAPACDAVAGTTDDLNQRDVAVPDVYMKTSLSDAHHTDGQLQRDIRSRHRHCIKKLSIWLPVELKDDFVDILILYDEDDRQVAENLRDEINLIRVHGDSAVDEVMAKAVLYDDAGGRVAGHVEWLDLALELSTYIFVIYTGSLLNECKLNAKSQAFFWATVVDKVKKKDSFCPVYLNQDAYKMTPAHIQCVRGLNIEQNGWQKKVKSMLEGRINHRLEQELEQEKRCMEYLISNYLQKVSEVLSRPQNCGSSVDSNAVTDNSFDIYEDSESGYNTLSSPGTEHNLWHESNIEQSQFNSDDQEQRPVTDEKEEAVENKRDSAQVVDKRSPFSRLTGLLTHKSVCLSLIASGFIIVVGLRLKK
jgi:hypothetical protein